jgi:arginyl-tRNA synthetase
MYKTLKDVLDKTLIKQADQSGRDIEIEIPKDESFGDLSTPVAMALAKQFKKTPKKFAQEIISRIEVGGVFEKVEIAGPGFINFTFTKNFLFGELRKLILESEGYLYQDIGKGKRVQIEFVSANPTGPLHLGHGRGAAVGSALSNLLEAAGYNVEREYYINDAGRQVQLLGLSVWAKYNQMMGRDYAYPEHGYRGDYINTLAEEFHQSAMPASSIRDFCSKKMLDGIKKDLEDFGITFDHWQSERELFDNFVVQKSINELRKREYVYDKNGAVWFKSSKLGDDKDRVIVKHDGEYTYFASDIAYHKKKIEKGYDEIIDIWGADHHGYIPRVQAVMQALGYPGQRLRILIVQMVTLLRGGTPVQMSKRTGEFITLREVMDEIGVDTTKFLFLTRRHDSHLEVDIETAKKESHENPVYYVQYAHARINSIFEKSRNQDNPAGFVNISNFNGSLFNQDEMRLIKKVLTYTMIFRNAVLAREPHRITFYLQELASMFHTYYQKFRVISEDSELTKARLALCEAVKIVLRHGLKILSVKAPEKM